MQTVALALSTATVTILDDPAGRRFAPASIQARITNIGQINDQFNIDVTGLPAGWHTLSMPGVRMRPGVDGAITLTFHPPRAPESLAGPRLATVRVTPQEQPAAGVEHQVTLILDPFVEATFALDQNQRTTDGDAIFTARLRNGGNVPLRYTLAASPGQDASLVVLCQPSQVSLGPGEEQAIEVGVAAPPVNGLARTSGNYPFTIQATPVTPLPEWPAVNPPPLTVSGMVVITPAPPVRVEIEPTRLVLIDLVATEATCVARLHNPSRRLVGVTVEARSLTADYDVEVARDDIMLLPESTSEIELTARRSALMPPTNRPPRQPFQISVRQIDTPGDLGLEAIPRAAPGSVTFTPPPRVEVLIQPLGLRVELAPPHQDGRRGHFHVVVTNQGNQPVPLLLDLVDLEHEVRYAFGARPSRYAFSRRGAGGHPRGYRVEATPGRTVTPLEVRPARGRVGGPSQRFPFRVTTAINDHPIDGLTREAAFEYHPLSRRRVVALALLPLLLLTGAVAAPLVTAPNQLSVLLGGLTSWLPPLPGGALPEPRNPPAPQPTPTQARQKPSPAPARIEIEDSAFRGGFNRPNIYKDSAGEGRTAMWIYGAQSDYPAMSAAFRLESAPPAEARLTLAGMDDQASSKTRIRVTLNDRVIFEGDNPLENNRWSQVALPAPAGSLRPGQNTLEIRNLTPGRNFNEPPWFMLDLARVEWDN